ncbi:MAG: iron ABC transporter permease [Methanomassiliicoccaceae archaeon]|jgi:iron complex transport system permease protein|nr:iron ABC transporter permease [Methanomassiliicoccaceae archaeon]
MSKGSAEKRRIRLLAVTAALVIVLLISMVLDLSQAFIPLSLKDAFMSMIGMSDDPIVNTIVRNVNGPRVVMGCMVGAGLGVSGAVMQAVFRNPMASPYILGLSSGAAFGAALAMTIPLGTVSMLFMTPLLAFVFCVATTFLVYFISRVGGRVPTETLLLSGIAVGSLFSALVSLLTYLAGERMAGIVYWTMGNLSQNGWNNTLIVIPLILAGSLIMLTRGREMNAMMLGDAHAKDLGVDVKKVRLEMLISSSLVTAAAVAFCGVIGFVGLVVPHIIRILTGPDNKALLPLSMLGGAAFVVLCDYLSRSLFTNLGILPIGILTSLVGAPYFIYLLRRRRHEVGWN